MLFYKQCRKKCKTQKWIEMEEEKKILRKRSKNQHLKLKIVSFSWFQRLIFFTSFSCALIRWHVFCEFSWFQNAIDFFSSSLLVFVCFIRSISTFSIRFHSLLYLVVQPFHPFCFDDRATAEKSYSYRFVFLPQFVSIFNFEFAKCIRFQSILSSISR